MDVQQKQEIVLANSYIALLEAKDFKQYALEFEKGAHHNMSQVKKGRFLSKLVSYLIEKKMDGTIDYTLRQCTNDFDDDDLAGVIGDLVSLSSFPLSGIKYLLEKYWSISKLEIIQSQFETTKGLTAKYIGKRLADATGETIDETEIDILIEQVNKTNIDTTGHCLNWLQSQTTVNGSEKICPKPTWVSVKPGETKEVMDSPKWKDLPSEGKEMESLESIASIMSEFELTDQSGKPVSEELISKVVAKSKAMDTPFKKGLPGDPDRYFGPLNNKSSGEGCDTSIVRDGCRMLTCNCNKYDDEKDNTSESPTVWFTGSCDDCLGKIVNESHAIRFPYGKGGWIGCYCSFACMQINRQVSSGSVDDSFIQSFRTRLNATGLIDRQEWDTSKQSNRLQVLEYRQSKATMGIPQGLARVEE